MYKMCMKEFSIFRLEAKQEMFNKIPKKYFFLFFLIMKIFHSSIDMKGEGE